MRAHHDDVGRGQRQTTVNVASWSKLVLGGDAGVFLPCSL